MDAYELPTALVLFLLCIPAFLQIQDRSVREVGVILVALALVGALGGWIYSPTAWLGAFGDRSGLLVLVGLILVTRVWRSQDKPIFELLIISTSTLSSCISFLQNSEVLLVQFNTATPSRIGGLAGSPNWALVLALAGSILSFRNLSANRRGIIFLVAFTVNVVCIAIIGSGLGIIATALLIYSIVVVVARQVQNQLFAVAVGVFWAIPILLLWVSPLFFVSFVLPATICFRRKKDFQKRSIRKFERAALLTILFILFVPISIFWLRDERYLFAKVAIRVLRENLWFGIGPSRFADYSQGFGGDVFRNEGIYVESAHNLPLQFLLSFGLVGAVLLLLFGFFVRKRAIQPLYRDLELFPLMLFASLFMTTSVKGLILLALTNFVGSQISFERSSNIVSEVSWVRVAATAASGVLLLWPISSLVKAENLIAKELASGKASSNPQEKWSVGNRTGDLRILANSVSQYYLEGGGSCSNAISLAEKYRYRPEVIELSLASCGADRNLDGIRRALSLNEDNVETHAVDLLALKLAIALSQLSIADVAFERISQTWSWCDALDPLSVCGQVLRLSDQMGRTEVVSKLVQLPVTVVAT